jgi:FKBP-type peptidyl-prolyl cis-trans isomerase FkpA
MTEPIRRSARRLALAFIVAATAAACGGGDSTPSSPTPTPASAPFSSTDLVVGGGTTATQGRTVTVSYVGWLYDPTRTDSKGTQFDASNSFPFILGAGRVIAGWDQGVVGMRVGGTRRLVIPPSLGYGGVANGPIPANSTLVFDIVLLNVS